MREEIMAWINCLPEGWVSAFGQDLCDDLLNALGKYQNDFVIEQLKDKYGEMRLYFHWRDIEYPLQIADELWEVSALVQDIIEHYTKLSSKTCVRCGTHAPLRTINGWVEPLCDSCL